MNILQPIFIGGCPRSGTTMLGSMIGSMPSCIVTPESIFKQHCLTKLDQLGSISNAEFLKIITLEMPFWNLQLDNKIFPQIITNENVISSINIVIQQYADSKSKKNVKYWIDHTPPNIISSLLLGKYYPEAKFIHLVRDPRAVANSAIPRAWGPNSPKQFTNWWKEHIAEGLKTEQHFKEKCIRVIYEDLLSNPDLSIKRICDFIGIEFHSNLLLKQDFQPHINTKYQHLLVGQMPDTSRLKGYETELHPLSQIQISSILKEWIIFFGYESIHTQMPDKSNILKLKWLLYTCTQIVLSPFRRKLLRIQKKKQLRHLKRNFLQKN